MSASEAEALGSTLKTVISEELRTTGNIVVEDGKVTRIFSKNYGQDDSEETSAFGAVDGSGNPSDKGQITLGGRKILSSAAYTYGYQAAVSIKYEESIVCYHTKLTLYDRSGDMVKEYNFDVVPVVKPTVNG